MRRSTLASVALAIDARDFIAHFPRGFRDRRSDCAIPVIRERAI